MSKYLVTGAGGGMGSAICRALTERGHKVVGLDLSEPSEPCGDFIRADLANPASLEKAFSKIGRLDGVIHAAGLYNLGSLVEMGEDGFSRIFNVNLFGVARVNRLAVPLLNEGARIVIITSELAPLDPLPFTGIYAVTKAALDKYAFSLAMELQLLGVSVSVVRPGAVDTGMLPASMRALDRFVEETKLYSVNAERFKKIVAGFESHTVSPQKLAERVLRPLEAKRPRFVYSLNRNPLLMLLSALPRSLQLFVIRKLIS